MKRKVLLGIILFCAGLSLFLLHKRWSNVDDCPQPDEESGTVVVWNKTGADVEVSLKQYRRDGQKVSVPKNVRGCIPIYTKGKGSSDPDPISYIYVTHNDKKYRFSENEVLNVFPDKEMEEKESVKIPTRHFVLLVIAAGVGEWENIKKRVETETFILDDKVQYLVLSNYHKLGDFWAPEAHLSLVKAR